MKLIFNGRIFKHPVKTGVEVYAEQILKNLYKHISLTCVEPNTKNKYVQHLWEHSLLPLKAKKFDLIFSPSSSPIFKPKKVKIIATIHDIAFLKYSDTVSKPFYYYYRFLTPRIINVSDAIVTVSHFSKCEIEAYYPNARGKTFVIHNGVDQRNTHDVNVKKEPFMLFVGSFNKRKNLIRLLRAYLLIADHVDCKLMLIGHFSDIFIFSQKEQQLLQKAFAHPAIEFREDVTNDELVECYQKALFFVYPSLYEGFGIPPVEAMACGTPVLTSNVASLPEVCGNAAYYINPRDVECIRKGMLEMIQNETLRQNLIIKGLEQTKKYNWENSAKQHLKLFQKIMLT